VGIIENLESLLAQGRDDALLRYSLANEYFKDGRFGLAVEHLQRAVEHDSTYSAAWKLYGKALVELGDLQRAIHVFDTGIAAAERRGDIQAAKEMKVFRKRARKGLDG